DQPEGHRHLSSRGREEAGDEGQFTVALPEGIYGPCHGPQGGTTRVTAYFWVGLLTEFLPRARKIKPVFRDCGSVRYGPGVENHQLRFLHLTLHYM
ncbi:hypothetical protein BaRGS_00007243, partial [Batillaria attramentaria]